MRYIKYLIFFIFLFVVSGCNLINYPINVTEQFLKNYQNLDKDVVNSITTNSYKKLSSDNYKIFKEVLLKQYKNLKYEIESYEVSDTEADVYVKVDVYNLKKAKDEAYQYFVRNKEEFYTNGVYNDEKYIYYELSEMFKTDERVIEKLNIKLTKENGIWKINSLTDIDILKLHGLY